MDQDGTYQVSQSLAIQIRDGQLLATSSVSRLPRLLRHEAIPVLQAFGGGTTPEEARTKLAAEWDFDEAGFAEVVAALVEDGLLLRAAGATPPAIGFGSLQMQHGMVRDTIRVHAYRAAITAHAAGRTVVEVGCGTGILSIFAAKAGARRVVAIEETAIAELARELVRANGCEDIVELVVGNSRDVRLDARADLLIHEIIGIDPFGEDVIAYLQDARERFLVPGGRLIPWRLEILCVGVQVADNEEIITRDQALREAEELAGMYGLDLSPYLNRIGQGPEFLRGARVGHTRFAHPILSGESRLFDIHFDADLSDASAPVTTELEIEKSGELNSVLLFFRAHLDETIRLTNSPHAPKTSWGWLLRDLPRKLDVKAGDRVRIHAQVNRTFGHDQLVVDLA